MHRDAARPPAEEAAARAADDQVELSQPWSTDGEETDVPPPRRRVRRRVYLPVVLFLLTMLSTFVAGATGWLPHVYLSMSSPIPFRLAILEHWQDGLIYMVCLLLTLLAHEMGHFLMTLYYGVPASFPYFLPLPVTPIGTLGAVIRMDNRDADRRQMFDIGIAGPLAGLVIAVPLLVIGVQQLDLTAPLPESSIPSGSHFELGMPLGLRWLMNALHPKGYASQTVINVQHVNPFFMAGWVGLLVTALNMMPVSQLDGGHIIYCLFGRRAHWIARTFMVLTIATMVFLGVYQMSLMVGLILLIGVDHPPTSNDRIPLGIGRQVLGLASLIIPVLCLTLEPIRG
jgi:membrane-associated protease RseP (regulator of RpoE activity)